MENKKFRRDVGVVFFSVLAGCAQLNPELNRSEQFHMLAEQSETVSNVLPYSHGKNIINFVISAKVGETRTIKDEQERESNLITAGNFYHAASGKLCRKFTKETTNSDVRKRVCSSQVVCRNHAGDWYQVRQIINVDQPEKGIVKCTRFSKSMN